MEGVKTGTFHTVCSCPQAAYVQESVKPKEVACLDPDSVSEYFDIYIYIVHITIVHTHTHMFVTIPRLEDF